MAEQRKKLMQMLTAAVKGLDRLEQLVPVVQDLGRRHARYGVAESHYDTVGAALLWTLEMGLGKAFTAEMKEAWTAVYVLLATTMKDAARERGGRGLGACARGPREGPRRAARRRRHPWTSGGGRRR